MSPKNVVNESIIGLTLDELGAASAVVKHRDGSTDQHPLETTREHGPQPEPQSWRHPRTSALTEIPKFGLTRQQHVERSLRVEAALTKILGNGFKAELMEKHAYKALMEVIKAMGFEDRL